MDNMVISFSRGGKTEAMHNDAFNLSFLGKRKVTRASDILFDEGSSKWDIYMRDEPDGPFIVTAVSLKGFSDYEEARKFEVEWLNTCRLSGADPTSEHGLYTIAPIVRNTEST